MSALKVLGRFPLRKDVIFRSKKLGLVTWPGFSSHRSFFRVSGKPQPLAGPVGPWEILHQNRCWDTATIFVYLSSR